MPKISNYGPTFARALALGSLSNPVVVPFADNMAFPTERLLSHRQYNLQYDSESFPVHEQALFGLTHQAAADRVLICARVKGLRRRQSAVRFNRNTHRQASSGITSLHRHRLSFGDDRAEGGRNGDMAPRL